MTVSVKPSFTSSTEVELVELNRFLVYSTRSVIGMSRGELVVELMMGLVDVEGRLKVVVVG